MDVKVTIVNDGNMTVTTDGMAGVAGRTGTLSQADGTPVIELLPGDRRVLSSRVDSIWPAGPLPVTTSLTTSTQGGTPLPVAGPPES